MSADWIHRTENYLPMEGIVARRRPGLGLAECEVVSGTEIHHQWNYCQKIEESNEQ